MGSEDSETKEPENVITSIKRVVRKRLILSAVLVGIIAALSLILCFSSSLFAPVRQVVLTFWISFSVGLCGAGVYLSLILMTEKDLKILENNMTRDLGLMTFIFLLSGGFVAAVTQVSTGTLVPNGLQAVFMLGFGWLGALAGVAGSSTVAQVSKEKRESDSSKKAAEIERDSSLQGIIMENKELNDKLEAAYAIIEKLKGGE